MTITKRTLEKWRKEALEEVKSLEGHDRPTEGTIKRREVAQRVLRLTQKLIDQHLMRRKS